MKEKDLPKILRPFYEAPGQNDQFNTRLGKNIAYSASLVSQGPKVKNEVIEGLHALKIGYPKEPNGSFAVMYIIETASRLADESDVPLFVEMLSWPWVIVDHQYPAYALGVAQKGSEQDIASIEKFWRNFSRGKHTPMEKEKISGLVERAIQACLQNGPRGSFVIATRVYEPGFPDCRGYVR